MPNLRREAEKQKQNKNDAYSEEYQALPDSSFPYFDNYTGPYWSDGKFQASVANGKSKPVSKLDWHSREHDSCFARGKDIYDCDEIYYQNTRGLDLRGRLVGIIPKLFHGGFFTNKKSGREGGVGDKMTQPTPAQSAGGQPYNTGSRDPVPVGSLRPIGGTYSGIGLDTINRVPNSFPGGSGGGSDIGIVYEPKFNEPPIIDGGFEVDQAISHPPLYEPNQQPVVGGYLYESKGRLNSQKTWQKPRKHKRSKNKNKNKRRNKRSQKQNMVQ